jgi:hypothetical protein
MLNGGNDMQSKYFWAVIAITVLCGGIYAGFPVFRAYNAYWIFKEDVEELVSFAVENVQSDQKQQIVRQIGEMLDSMNVRYDQEDVDVTVDKGIEKVTVDVWYTQTINVPLFPNPKHFHVHAQSLGTVG